MNPIRTHVPEGHTIIFEQKQRKGKTLGGVIFGLDAFQTGRRVFSNIQLGYPHEPIQFQDIRLQDGISPYWNGHIFIDELNFYFDARRSMKSENIQFSTFLLQQKKQGCNLTGTTHDLMSLDMRIRDHHDFLVIPEVYPAFPEPPQMLKMRVINGPLQADFDKTIRLDCRPFLGLYDSFAVYDPFKTTPKASRGKRYPDVEL